MRLYGGAENIPEEDILPDDFKMPPFVPVSDAHRTH
jgi:hypothetical protein